MRVLCGICLGVLLALTGCSTDREPGDLFAPDEVGALVVDATLIVGDELPPVLLSRTLAPGDLFSLDGVAVTGAEVSIRWGSNEAAYNELAPGVYWMPAPPVVRPTTVYHLEVRSTEGEVLTASTTTPRAFSVNRWVLLDNNGESVLRTLGTFAEHGDTLYSAPENQLVYQQGLLEARFDRGDEIAFQIGLSSLDEGSDFVIDPDFFDEEDFEDLERDVASPPFDALDGRIRLPWFAIYFEGRYMVRFYSVDRNWYDLARSLPEFAGGGSGFGGQAGDDFERPLFRVNGGIGLFGSAAVDTVGFTIHPAP